MPTRLYLANLIAAPVSPTQDAGWENGTGAFHRGKLLAAKNAADTLANKSNTNTGALNSDTILGQYVSDRLTPGTVFTTSDTLKGQARTIESLAAADSFGQWCARIVDDTGATVQATILAQHTLTATPTGSMEWLTTSTNRRFPPDTAGPPTATVALTSDYTTVPGDRLVIEMGNRRTVATTSFIFQIGVGAALGTADLPEDVTTTAGLVPWVEFSNTVTFGEGPAYQLRRFPLGV